LIIAAIVVTIVIVTREMMSDNPTPSYYNPYVLDKQDLNIATSSISGIIRASKPVTATYDSNT